MGVEGNICLVQHLQTQNLSFPTGSHMQYTFPEGYGESDAWSHLFGFRKIESHIDSATGGRLFKVNGQPMFIHGGNWILSDGLLCLSREHYETDIKFHADMNFNMIRYWGGGLAERPELSNLNGPLDHDLLLLCARDNVKLLRNHPSLALWVGENEQVPPDDINRALKNDLRLHPYFENSNEISKSSEALFAVSKDPSQYFDGTCVYIQGSLWDGFANVRGASLMALTKSEILKQILRMIITAMDSMPRLVLSGWLLQILSEQQCLKKAGRFRCLSKFLVGTRNKFQTPYGNNINTFPIQCQKNVLIRLNFMEPQRILKIFV
uniref:Uncharacterized protein n=1 Tax=Quercus lobata TaxID=97700 RepID=A0A7N2L4W2_QUELO